ncbi:hypothetical protein L7F22_056842 [Adiantum nelumboides]|nr:hypothetical protein [Adiantum nelumboides]MCO5602706.1 hypothetical protein [Adiantum nelumboides]
MVSRGWAFPCGCSHTKLFRSLLQCLPLISIAHADEDNGDQEPDNTDLVAPRFSYLAGQDEQNGSSSEHAQEEATSDPCRQADQQTAKRVSANNKDLQSDDDGEGNLQPSHGEDDVGDLLPLRSGYGDSNGQDAKRQTAPSEPFPMNRATISQFDVFEAYVVIPLPPDSRPATIEFEHQYFREDDSDMAFFANLSVALLFCSPRPRVKMKHELRKLRL